MGIGAGPHVMWPAYQGGHGRTIKVFQTRYNRLLIVLVCGCMLDVDDVVSDTFEELVSVCFCCFVVVWLIEEFFDFV
jgi:hypothetical protein